MRSLPDTNFSSAPACGMPLRAMKQATIPLRILSSLGDVSLFCYVRGSVHLLHNDIVNRSMEAAALPGSGRSDPEADIARAIAFVVEARRDERHLADPGAGCLGGAGQHAVVGAQHLDEQGIAGLRRLGIIRYRRRR